MVEVPLEGGSPGLLLTSSSSPLARHDFDSSQAWNRRNGLAISGLFGAVNV
jgi:hypothetical protein